LDPKTRRIFKLVAWFSFLTIVAVVVYGVVASLVTTGSGLAIGVVLVEVEWPLPYFAKPVSYFSVACVALFYSGLRLWESRIATWPGPLLSLLQLLGFVVAFASAYEVLYNFMIWGAIFSVQILQGVTSPDFIKSPALPIPWNLDFATKAFSALFVISGYSVYYLRRLSKAEFI
jgi:ABC-type antimicrobial peptide transport system permease subunit